MPDQVTIFRESLSALMQRDMRSIRRQIEAYPDDESPWLTAPGIANSAGNLVLHLSGNLRHFIGAVLGGSQYSRDRDAEFARRGLSRAELVSEVESAIGEVGSAIDRLTPEQLASGFPIPLGPERRMVSTSAMLLHLASHLTYHLGQIDYHRRFLTADASAVDMLPLKEIPESGQA